MKVKYQVNCSYLNPCHVEIDEETSCPICKHSIRPTFVYGSMYKTNQNSDKLCIIYTCPHCYENFICSYSNHSRPSPNGPHVFSKRTLIAPSKFENQEFAECIQKISPSFVKIYNQASEAEHYNLDEISGIGYRKALEFLIKDFLITHEHKDESKVVSTALGCCIDTMIENPQLKTVASRATWLGNDQTHYEQKYTDNDITDLKRLIKLSVNWIEMIYLTDEAESIEKK